MSLYLRSWEWQEFLSKSLSDHFTKQLHQLQQILGDRIHVDLSQVAALQLQQNPSSPYNAMIHNEQQSISAPDRDMSILAAIRELQRNLDWSHEFSAVIAAIQEKDVKHTPVLVALQEQKTDINAQFDDLRELFRQAGVIQSLADFFLQVSVYKRSELKLDC